MVHRGTDHIVQGSLNWIRYGWDKIQYASFEPLCTQVISNHKHIY